MGLKFYKKVANGWVKTKVRKFRGLIHTLGEVTGEKLLGDPSFGDYYINEKYYLIRFFS